MSPVAYRRMAHVWRVADVLPLTLGTGDELGNLARRLRYSADGLMRFHSDKEDIRPSRKECGRTVQNACYGMHKLGTQWICLLGTLVRYTYWSRKRFLAHCRNIEISEAMTNALACQYSNAGAQTCQSNQGRYQNNNQGKRSVLPPLGG
jgi:hypothetical protein